MAFSPSSPVTGAAATGLTSPTYTLTADTQPSTFAKQYTVSALGGTQTGVDVHSIARPFTLAMFRPQNLLQASFWNSLTGWVKKNGRNKYDIVARKGLTPVAGATSETGVVRIQIDLPAGAEAADTVNVKALLSAAFGLAYASANGVSDTVQSGTL